MSDQPGEMVPRLYVRDVDDAVLILTALRAHATARMMELAKEARKPGADQFALTIQQKMEIDNISQLMADVSDTFTEHAARSAAAETEGE